MDKIVMENIGETLYYEKMPNGLTVYILHKKDYQKTYASFSTKYGSIDNHFRVNGQNENVPDGIAHFLEHKLFEKKDGDIFQEFAANGAQANAFTSFVRTTYLFSGTEQISKNIDTLLNFVQDPYFTEETVDKEKGIIEQEIKMYQDSPDWLLYFGLIESLYHKTPIRVNIAGSIDSIYSITKDQLYKCYQTFYHPSNMMFFVATGLDPKTIMEQIKENQGLKKFGPTPNIQRFYPEEPEGINHPKKETKASIGVPKVLFGFKETPAFLTGKDFIKKELTTQLLLDTIVGNGTDLYEELYGEGLIDEDFSYEFNLEEQFAFSLIGGNSKNPEALVARVSEEIKNKKMHHLDESKFVTFKKKRIGDFLRKLNSPDYIANQFTRYRFNDSNLFDILEVLENISINDIKERLVHFDFDRMSVSIVKPN